MALDVVRVGEGLPERVVELVSVSADCVFPDGESGVIWPHYH